jgi:hypothetical protein
MSTGEHRGLLSRDGIPLGSIRLTLNRVRGCWSGASVTDERPWRAARPGTDAAALSFRASVSAVAQASPRLRPTHSTRSSSAPAASSLTMNRLTWASSRTPRSLSWVRRRPHVRTHADTGTTDATNSYEPVASVRALATLPRPSRAPLRRATKAWRTVSVALGWLGSIWTKKSAVVVVSRPPGSPAAVSAAAQRRLGL